MKPPRIPKPKPVGKPKTAAQANRDAVKAAYKGLTANKKYGSKKIKF